MKKNRITLLLFLLLAALAAYLWMNRSGSTIKGELRDFAFADTASIDKLFLADKDGRQVTIVKNPDYTWTVNGKFLARKDAIDVLLQTIKAVEVRSPVGKNLYNNTMKLMATKSVKLEIYAKGELVKTYYVGHPTMDNLGTFMYLEGSSTPFITHIPGFNGFLSTRYFASEAEWRDKSIYRFEPRRIVEVTIDEKFRPQRSFRVFREADSTYHASFYLTGKVIEPLNINAVKKFLTAFQATYFERLDHDIPAFRRDSVIKAGPFAVIMVKTDQGKSVQLTCYRKPVSSQSRLQLDLEGKTLPFDYDRFYGISSEDTSMMVCQYFHFDRIFKDPQGFIMGQTEKPTMNRFE